MKARVIESISKNGNGYLIKHTIKYPFNIYIKNHSYVFNFKSQFLIKLK